MAERTQWTNARHYSVRRVLRPNHSRHERLGFAVRNRPQAVLRNDFEGRTWGACTSTRPFGGVDASLRSLWSRNGLPLEAKFPATGAVMAT
jgi:hypothetical protein